ncbi:hypothetical protein BOX15_Mlig014928g2 [Macrostomum lignano]|uniref:Transcription elongation factor n=1 Tax=Macrostomum lignano TaxID=282301 RepID=A0A267H3Y4_9PLAT|nr:hypothetical protein BOX15_Mlig014928g2 [Macrostomum lignano]
MSVDGIDYQRIAKKLEKMTTKNKIDEAKVARYLSQLREATITIAVLQKTGLGIIVNRLRRGLKSDTLLSEARQLIKKWKKLLDSAQQQQQAAAAAAPSPTADENGSGADTTEAKRPRVDADEEASPNGSSEGAATAIAAPAVTFKESERLRTTDSVRLKCREMLQQALESDTIPSGAYEPNYLAAEIETCVHLETGSKLDMKYKNRIRSRVMNLRDTKNPNLRYCVLMGNISPAQFAKMSAEEMASDDMRKLRERLTKEAIDDHQMSMNSGTSTDMLKCGKCKKNNCTYNQLQTRSADEPMTTFVLCNECGHRWKFN